MWINKKICTSHTWLKRGFIIFCFSSFFALFSVYPGSDVSPEKSLLNSAKIYINEHFRGYSIDWAKCLLINEQYIPVVITSSPIPEKVPQEYQTGIFLFSNSDPVTYVLIDTSPFIKPALTEDEIYNECSCSQYKIYYLSKEDKSTIIIAQYCEAGQKMLYHFMILDKMNMRSPYFGTSTWDYSEEGLKEVFVPNDIPYLPQGISPLRGDGMTVVTGVEIKEEKVTPEWKYFRRKYSFIWKEGVMIKNTGSWESWD
ncbi:MAG: hypothetical protein JXJ04_06915 [Spirochaetales bacterium]|nr:hypothetical protein [Spirochaetales bacterium]